MSRKTFDVILGRLILGSIESSAVVSCDNDSNDAAIVDWAMNDLRRSKVSSSASLCLEALSALGMIASCGAETGWNDGICLVDGTNAWLP